MKADLTIQSEMQTAGSAELLHMKMSFAFGNMRTEMTDGPGAGSGMILKAAEKKMIMIIPPQQQYMVQALPAGSATPAETDKPPTVERTGRKEKISGYACEQVIFKDADNTRVEMWFSPDAPKIAECLESFKVLAQGPSSRMGMRWLMFMLQNRDLNTYPVRTISFDATGAESSRMTVTAFQTDKVAAALFEPPAGYTEMKMPGWAQPAPSTEKSAAPSGASDMQKLQELSEAIRKSGRQPTPEEIKQMQELAEKMQPASE